MDAMFGSIACAVRKDSIVCVSGLYPAVSKPRFNGGYWGLTPQS